MRANNLFTQYVKLSGIQQQTMVFSKCYLDNFHSKMIFPLPFCLLMHTGKACYKTNSINYAPNIIPSHFITYFHDTGVCKQLWISLYIHWDLWDN